MTFKKILPPLLTLALSLFFLGSQLFAEDSLRLESFEYPFAVKSERIFSQQQELDLSYMELPAIKKQRATVVLLHDSTYCAAYWKETAEALTKSGYEVIMPDQVGSGKSTKPKYYQYSYQQLVDNTRSLLLRKRLWKVHLIGHGTGATLALRYALMYPKEVLSLTLINPVGIDQRVNMGLPYISVDARFQEEMKLTAQDRKSYQTAHYYNGEWQPQYDRWIQLFEHFRSSPDYHLVAWNHALIQDMVSTQSIHSELSQLDVPALLIYGSNNLWQPNPVSTDTLPTPDSPPLKSYSEIINEAAQLIPKSKVTAIENSGFSPHLDNFASFLKPIVPFLNKPTWDKKVKDDQKPQKPD